MAKTATVPVFMMRLERNIELLQLTRVPSIGECIHMRDDNSSWRVVNVDHIPQLPNINPDEESVAEIHCVRIDDGLDHFEPLPR